MIFIMQYEWINSFNLSSLFGVIFLNLHADFVTLAPFKYLL